MRVAKHVNAILVLMVVICIIIASLYFYVRIDLTQTKAYSLSDASKNVINIVDSPLTIRLFFSKNLPPPILEVRNYLQDLLTEYQTYSRGMIVFEFINPGSQARFFEEAQNAKIPAIPFEIYEDHRYELRDIYMGAIITYKNKSEVIPFFPDTAGLEYILTSQIRNVVAPRERHIAFYQPVFVWEGHIDWSNPIPENLRALDRLLSDTSTLDRVDLLSPVPASTDLLIINAVKDSLHIAQLYYIDQYMLSGKPIIFFLDRYVSALNGIATLFDNNLLDMLRFHGIHIKPALVLDGWCHQIQTQTMHNGSMVPLNYSYPFFPVISSFPDNLGIAKHIRWLQSYFTSEVHYARTLRSERPMMTHTPLLLTSRFSSEIGGMTIDTDYKRFLGIDFRSQFTQAPKPVMSFFTGMIESYFPDTMDLPPAHISSSHAGKIVVAGSTSFLSSDLLLGVSGNANIILNLIDYLTGEAGYIDMRGRDVSVSSLMELTTDEKNVIKYIMMVIPAFMIVCGGLSWYGLHKARVRAIKRTIPL